MFTGPAPAEGHAAPRGKQRGPRAGGEAAHPNTGHPWHLERSEAPQKACHQLHMKGTSVRLPLTVNAAQSARDLPLSPSRALLLPLLKRGQTPVG